MARLKNRLFQINQSSLHHSALDFFHCCKKYESAKKRSSFRQTISTLDKVMILTQGCIFQTETFLFQFVPDTTDINAAFPIASLSLYSSFSISLSFSFLLSPSTHLSQSLSFSFLLSPSIALPFSLTLSGKFTFISISVFLSLSLDYEQISISLCAQAISRSHQTLGETIFLYLALSLSTFLQLSFQQTHKHT